MCKECAGKSKNLNANFPNEANYANMRKNSRHSPNLRNTALAHGASVRVKGFDLLHRVYT